MNLERPHGRPLRVSTKIPVRGATPKQTNENKRLAEAVYSARMGDLARTRHRLPATQTSALRLDKFIEWYRLQITAQHQGAAREGDILDTLAAPPLGPMPLGDLTRQSVREWMTARSQVVSPATVNREVDVLKSVLREAAELQHITASPIAGMKRLRTTPPTRALLSYRHQAKLMPALQPHLADLAVLLVLGQDSLVRLKDLLDLRWSDDDGDRLWIREPKDPNQSEGYWVPLSRRARRALDTLPRIGPHIFERRRRPKHRGRAIRQALARVCERLDIPFGQKNGGITWHWATRRTGASRMLHHGAQLKAVQKVGHWKRADTVLEIYNEIIGDEDRDAVELPAKRPRGTRSVHVKGRKRRRRQRKNAA